MKEFVSFISDELGIGKGLLKEFYGDTYITFMQGVEIAFNGKNNLNQGKICC